MDSVKSCVHVLGGGTTDPVRRNMALSAVSYGRTARRVAELVRDEWPEARTELHLTCMAAAGEGGMETVDDVRRLLRSLVTDDSTVAVFMAANLCAFAGALVDGGIPAAGLDLPPISPRGGQKAMALTPREEILDYVRAYRRELVLVGFLKVYDPGVDLAGAAQDYARDHACSFVVAKSWALERYVLSSPEGTILSAGPRDRDWVLQEAVRSAMRAAPERRRPAPPPEERAHP